MTRKHYIAIARAVAKARREQHHYDGLAVQAHLNAISQVATNMANELQKLDSDFNRDRFVAVCLEDARILEN